MGPEFPPETITPGRLAELVRDIDGQDVVDRAALLAALRTASWPTRDGFEN